MSELKDEDLLIRLRATEDAFVERKTQGDSKDWLPAAVAFANSAPVGYPAILFIGVKDDGTPEPAVNLESLQKTFNKRLADAYPQIYYASRVLVADGRAFLAVVIPGSPERPHFAGHAYVRRGPETRKASESEFAKLIAQRSSKAYEISHWTDRTVTVERWEYLPGRIKQQTFAGTIVECGQFYCRYRLESGQDTYSVPLSRVVLSFDDKFDRPKIEVHSHTPGSAVGA